MATQNPSDALARHYAAEAESRRAKVEAGDGEAVLHALLDSILGGVPMPDWLILRLSRAAYGYIRHDYKTLDDAFGLSRPKGYSHASAKRKFQKMIPFNLDVLNLSAYGIPIDGELFEAVGGLYGIKKTTASEWYRDGHARLGRPGEKAVLREALWPIYKELTGKDPPKRLFRKNQG